MRGLIKRSFSLSGHRTSVALEADFWQALDAIAAQRGGSMAGLVAFVDGGRAGDTPLASALRVLALRDALDRTDLAAGDGKMVGATGIEPVTPTVSR